MSSKSPGLGNRVWPITICGAPSSRVTRSTAAVTWSCWLMSAVTPMAVPPFAVISPTASSTGPLLRATIATLQPSSASILAAMRPMPLLPPVKKTTLPAMPRSIFRASPWIERVDCAIDHVRAWSIAQSTWWGGEPSDDGLAREEIGDLRRRVADLGEDLRRVLADSRGGATDGGLLVVELDRGRRYLQPVMGRVVHQVAVRLRGRVRQDVLGGREEREDAAALAKPGGDLVLGELGDRFGERRCQVRPGRLPGGGGGAGLAELGQAERLRRRVPVAGLINHHQHDEVAVSGPVGKGQRAADRVEVQLLAGQRGIGEVGGERPDRAAEQGRVDDAALAGARGAHQRRADPAGQEGPGRNVTERGPLQRRADRAGR